MRVSARAYEENPYCGGCYDERVALATAALPPMEWRLEGDYLVPVRGGEP